MKQLFFLLFLISLSLTAQKFSFVDQKVKTYPKLITAKDLANKINSDFSSDITKVRAAYSWLAQNISYDLEEFYNPKVTSFRFSYSSEKEKQQKIEALNNKIVTETLSKRKAVCEGYARTFAKLCTLLNIENEFIKGYVRNSPDEIGKPIANPNHAWNAVKINGVWKYFDVTWGAGYEINGKWKRNFSNYFFDIPKENLFFTHYPDDTLWQLRVKRFSKKTFYAQPIYKRGFFENNLELVSPTSGIVFKDKNGIIQIQLKNFNKQKIYFGFIGSKYSKKPKTIVKDAIATFTITAPENSKKVFLLVDNNVVLEFLIQ